MQCEKLNFSNEDSSLRQGMRDERDNSCEERDDRNLEGAGVIMENVTV